MAASSTSSSSPYRGPPYSRISLRPTASRPRASSITAASARAEPSEPVTGLFVSGRITSRRPYDFLVGPYETALAHNEVLIEVRIPLRHNTSSAYAKVERRVGDWAITAAGAAVTLDGQTILAARVGLTAVNPDPVALAELSAGLVGQPATEEVFAEAGRRAAQACTPVTDVRGTAEYKRHLAGELTVRTLRTAAGRVLGAPAAPEA